MTDPSNQLAHTSADLRRRRWLIGFLAVLTLAMSAFAAMSLVPGMLDEAVTSWRVRVLIPLLNLGAGPALAVAAAAGAYRWAARGTTALVLVNSVMALVFAQADVPETFQVGLSAGFVVYASLFAAVFLPFRETAVTAVATLLSLVVVSSAGLLPFQVAARAFEFTLFFAAAAMMISYLQTRDLWDLRREAAAREATSARMVVADRMAGVGLLAAGVAHELRNALTTVVMNNDLALESLQGTDDADLAESLEAVAAAAESLKQLTTDLARVGRSEESGETVGRPADAVGLAVRLTSGRVRSRARVEVVVNDTPAVPLSNLRLQQITVNLIQNAVQAFEAAPREGGNTVTLTVGSDTGGAYVQVRDDGPGMPEGVCAQAFEPFFTTRGHAAGTGLGLYVCKALVEEVGGTIELSSTLGEGSCVTIRLPTTDVANGAPIDGTADPEASFSLARGDTSG